MDEDCPAEHPLNTDVVVVNTLRFKRKSDGIAPSEEAVVDMEVDRLPREKISFRIGRARVSENRLPRERAHVSAPPSASRVRVTGHGQHLSQGLSACLLARGLRG